MMKIVGIAMIAISTIVVGFIYYDKYKRRVDSLHKFVKLLSCYKFELKWSRKDIKDVLKIFKDDKYIDEVKTLIYECDLCESFIKKNQLFKYLELNKEDENIIVNFLTDTGKGNFETEYALCCKTLECLEKRQEEAAAQFKKLGPLYLKLGIVCAVGLFIMLI